MKAENIHYNYQTLWILLLFTKTGPIAPELLLYIHVYRRALYFVLGGGRRGATLHKITFFSSHFTGYIKGTFKYRNGLFNFLCQQTVIIKIQAEMYLPVKCSSFPKSHLCCNRFHSFSWPSSAAPSCCMWKHKMLLLWSNEAVKFQKQYFTSWPSEMKSPLVIFYIAGKP